MVLLSPAVSGLTQFINEGFVQPFHTRSRLFEAVDSSAKRKYSGKAPRQRSRRYAFDRAGPRQDREDETWRERASYPTRRQEPRVASGQSNWTGRRRSRNYGRTSGYPGRDAVRGDIHDRRNRCGRYGKLELLAYWCASFYKRQGRGGYLACSSSSRNSSPTRLSSDDGPDAGLAFNSQVTTLPIAFRYPGSTKPVPALYEMSCTLTDAKGAPVQSCTLEWPPKLRQVVKAQNPSKGELSHGVVTQTVHERVQIGRRAAA